MTLAPELHQELANALKLKLERRFRHATRHGSPGAYDHQGAMAGLVQQLTGELVAEEKRHRAEGDAAAAEAFRAVREELLQEAADGVLSAYG